MSYLVNISVAIGAIALIVLLTPIAEILELFFYIVLLPVTLLFAIGVISHDSYKLIMSQASIKRHLTSWADSLRKETKTVAA